MKIYIDESGTFSVDKKNQEHSISCVVALIVPEIIEHKLFNAFERWKSNGLSENKLFNNEIKGSKLNEDDFQSFLLLLAQFDLIVEVDAVDLGLTDDIQIKNHKLTMAACHGKSITGHNRNNNFKRDIIASLSNPNYVQSLSISSLVYKVLSIALSYYAQRFPQELGDFQWIFDAKSLGGANINNYEKTLANIILPLVQTHCMDEPLIFLAGADYSFFNKYDIDREDLLVQFSSKINKSSGVSSITDIMRDIKFIQSNKNIGLQMVDILANCVRRASSDRLQFDGWKYLSSLIVKRNNAISVTRFDDPTQKQVKARTALANFIHYFNSYGKQMCVPENLSGINALKKGYISWAHLDEIPTKDTPVKVTRYTYY